MWSNFLQADFWPAMTSGLLVISELSSGRLVKSAPQFSRSGYHDLDAQKIQLWLLRNRVKRVLHCYCVTGNSRWRLAVESSPAKLHTPTLHTHCFCRGLQNCA